MVNDPIVIAGAGHAGVQAAASLREEGYAGGILLISDDTSLPYQRPPLSKAFMKKGANSPDLLLRGATFYPDHDIMLALGETVDAIDRAGCRVYLASGRTVRYRHLILATGSSARDAPFAGTDLDGVAKLRNLADAIWLRDRLKDAKDIVIVGAGFIGLEFAATAVVSGARVNVIEFAPRVMARAVSEQISRFFLDAHRAAGVTLSLNAEVVSLDGVDGRVRQVSLSDGHRLPADLVVIGIGTRARDDLAMAAGLDCSNGIMVDAALTSADPMISAVGDCALHINCFAEGVTRLESVQNAIDQARVVARKLTGKPASYDAVPWFWSDQGSFKLQMVGLSGGCDRSVCRGDATTGEFAIYSFRNGVLRCVETVNRPGDHMAARRLISSGVELTPEQAGDLDFDLRSLAGRRTIRAATG